MNRLIGQSCLVSSVLHFWTLGFKDNLGSIARGISGVLSLRQVEIFQQREINMAAFLKSCLCG